MFRTPIINQNERFLDIDEEPLVNGKVEVLDPVSNNPLTIWSYSDDEYTEMVNPVRLDVEGRTPQTIFCDRIAYIRVYKYLGLDEYNQPMFEFVREYYAGENENTESREYVVGMTALKTLDPSVNSSVNVLGYYQLGDCGLRTYVWDPNSKLDADNGYVVASNVEASGRWILQFDGPYIPSTYYGVDPQHISNAPALLTYAEQISGKKTAPGIYFVPGHYQNQIRWNTTKRVLISSNSQFDTGIDCAWVDVKGKPSTWIGDIFPSDSTCPVYSSWYKHARSFWGNNSRVKHTDGRNWIDNDIIANMTNANVTFITHQGTKLTTNTGTYKLIFNNCKVEGDYGFLDKDSACRFISMEMSDRFYNTNSITPANIEFSTVSGQEATLILDHFAKVENYAALLYKTGKTAIDMGNIYCGNTTAIDLGEYTEIRNLNANNATIGKSENMVKVIDSKASYVDFNGKALYLDHTNIRLKTFPNVNSISVDNGSIVQGGFSLTRGSVYCSNSTWAMDTAKTVTGTFSQSSIIGTVRSNNLEIYHSQVTTGKIEIYPLSVANPSSHYEFKFKAENSVFDTDVEFKPDNIWNIYFNVRICNNTFNGTYGFTCPYWVDVTTSKRTICNKPAVGLEHRLKYEGNTGNCPDIRYYGQVDCTLEGYWYDYDAAWMRGMTNPSVKYKVYTSVANKSNRYFVIENRYGCGQPSLIDNARNFGFGMRMGTDTNLATARLVAMSELVKDSLDSSFNTWAEAHGYTDLNDYFFRIVALPTDDADASHYDDNYKYYFW